MGANRNRLWFPQRLRKDYLGMSRLLLMLFLVVTIPAPADVSNTLDQLQQAADQGNADAQYEVGNLYEFGNGRPKDKVTALAWYMLAAFQGQVLAAKRRDQLKSRMTSEEIDASRKLTEQLVVPNKRGPQTPKPRETSPTPVP